MVNISESLAPYVFQFLQNGIIIFKQLPPSLYGEAEKLAIEYGKLCNETKTFHISAPTIDYDLFQEELIQAMKQGTTCKGAY